MSPPDVLLTLLSFAISANAIGGAGDDEPLCYYVSSYHVGLEWSDRVERGLRAGLQGHCRIESFHMDTKRYGDLDRSVATGAAAHERMMEISPDIVITSDDNAVRHFVEPWLIGTDMPVVFTGINWTIEEYDLPAPNVTGMIEVAPMKALLKLGRKLTGGGRRVVHFSADTLTARKEDARVERMAGELGLSVDFVLVDSVASWHSAWRRIQNDHDFILLGDLGAFESWQVEAMRRFTLANTRLPVFATVEAAMPYAAVGLTRVPEELGEWAAASAVAILGGLSPAEIPLITNRRWDAWINEPLLERIGMSIDPAFARTAKRVR